MQARKNKDESYCRRAMSVRSTLLIQTFLRRTFPDSPIWCNVVNPEHLMKKTRARGKTSKEQAPPAVRASISFPPDLYQTLEGLAKQKKVSLAWVVREASEKYVADQAAMTEK